jgi:hypothetical protein
MRQRHSDHTVATEHDHVHVGVIAGERSPAISNAEQSGRGTATIRFNLTRDGAGAIQSGTILFHYDLTGFPAGTTINLSHIHPVQLA